jgi:hypothetical protein
MAIQASLHDDLESSNSDSKHQITSTYSSSRSGLSFPKLVGGSIPDHPTAIIQLGIFYQFDSFWFPLISKYEAPTAICGYISMSLPLIIAKLNDSIKKPNIENLKSQLCDFHKVFPFIEDSMKFIHEWRSNYIKSHPKEFPTEKSKVDYKRAWVANYEISDYLQSKNAEMKEKKKFTNFISSIQRSSGIPPSYTRRENENERTISIWRQERY